MKKSGTLRIKIAHLEYEVLPLSAKFVQTEGRNFGLHVIEDNRIYIDAGQSAAEQVRILWHELIHAMHWAHNITKEMRDEEKVCLALETPLAYLFRDNPTLAMVFARAFSGKPLVE
jgi:hypothetical protein